MVLLVNIYEDYLPKDQAEYKGCRAIAIMRVSDDMEKPVTYLALPNLTVPLPRS